MKYVALIVKTGNGYSAHLPDIPGCIAAADTFEETRGPHPGGLPSSTWKAWLRMETPSPKATCAAVEVEVPAPGAFRVVTSRRLDRSMTLNSQQRDLPRGWSAATLADVCAVNPRTFTNPIVDDCPISFVPMAAVEAGTGLMDTSQVRKYSEVRKGYTRFSEGDVLFAKVTPFL